MNYNSIQTIRYMGNKAKLLKYIIPEIVKVTNTNGVVCDIMAGTNSVGYALKDKFQIITNDVQYYSYIISTAIIENQSQVISKEEAVKDIWSHYDYNTANRYYSFFVDNYSDTYFSKEQCLDIDSIRYSIEKQSNIYKKNLYLSALMGAMCIVQSTPGHFAQFMPKDHKRIIPLRQMNVWDEFLKKADDYNNLVFSKYNNKSYCSDYKLLLQGDQLNDVSTIYLDSPYNQEQYSRFYHVLETLCKYDYPELNHKAKYREDRFKSEFCYKKSVKFEFLNIIDFAAKSKKNLVISYTNKGKISYQDLVEICKSYFDKVDLIEIKHDHSTQGKGKREIVEVIITCYWD